MVPGRAAAHLLSNCGLPSALGARLLLRQHCRHICNLYTAPAVVDSASISLWLPALPPVAALRRCGRLMTLRLARCSSGVPPPSRRCSFVGSPARAARRAAMSTSPDTRVTHTSAHSGHKLRRNVGASQRRVLTAKSRRPANGGECDPIIGSSTRFLECRGACCAARTPAQMSGFLDVASRGSRRSGAAIHRRDVGQHAMRVDVLNGDIEGVPRSFASPSTRPCICNDGLL